MLAHILGKATRDVGQLLTGLRSHLVKPTRVCQRHTHTHTDTERETDIDRERETESEIEQAKFYKVERWSSLSKEHPLKWVEGAKTRRDILGKGR